MTTSKRDVCQLLLGVGAMIFCLPPVHADAQLIVGAGTTAIVQPGDAECVTAITVRNDSAFAVKEQDCDGSRLKSKFVAGTSNVPDTVDLTASARFVKQFMVETTPDAPAGSFLPVFVSIPVSWRGVLQNDSAIPSAGPLDDVGANVDVNMYVRIAEGDASDASVRVRTLEIERFMGASHAGISGCLSVPKTKVQAAKMLAKCVIAVFHRDEGAGTIYLSTVIETGKTYNVEIESVTDLFTFNAGQFGGSVTLGGHPSTNFDENIFTSDPFGLTWTGPMRITVGSDPRREIADLVDEIAQLREDLDRLREQFLNHSHEYLTGKGVGHNDLEVSTSGPIVP